MVSNQPGKVDEEFMQNMILQKEEIEALSAIYGDDFLVREGCNRMDFEESSPHKKSHVMPSFSITIKPDVGHVESQTKGSQQLSEASLIISFQEGYPTTCPPTYQLSIPWIHGGQKERITAALEELYLEHLGENIIYLWVEKVREFLHEELKNISGEIASAGDVNESERHKSKQHETQNESTSNGESKNTAAPGDLCGMDPSSLANAHCHFFQEREPQSNYSSNPIQIQTGTPLTDRKSTFQAHVAPIGNASDVKMVLEELHKNKKIASATHNMYAYRIFKGESKTWLQDCDDDGETHAGSRLLHLLQILDAKNVLVVVSRWYGGILLHADRFKHINNVAREALTEFGFLSSAEEMEGSKTKRTSSKR